MRIVVIGAGYRARFFFRVAKAHPLEFEICGVLCRSEQRALEIRQEFGFPVIFTDEEVDALKPDYIIVAVSKYSMYQVSSFWTHKGYPVLCETPVGMTRAELDELEQTRNQCAPLMVAEQYQYYPAYQKIIELISSGKIGQPVMANVSLAHYYHGFSLIRHMLMEPCDAGFQYHIDRFQLPVTRTGDRYNVYTDGIIKNSERALATIIYADNKIGILDFDSDQYHSNIRHNTLKITGTRGEIIDGDLYYLDEQNTGHHEQLTVDFQRPRESSQDDEAAIYHLMIMAGKAAIAYKDGSLDDPSLSWANDNLNHAICDARMSLL